MSLGENIQKYRIKKKMTQQQLGAELGVTAIAVHYYEQGKKKPTLDNFVIMTEILECSADELLFGNCKRN